MYLNIGNGAAPPNKNIGNFGGSDYWSSSEVDYYFAYGQWFAQDNGTYQHYKDWGKQVRAIRTF
jgi:hypothetical protein